MKCKHFDICHRDEDILKLVNGYCILHARGEKSAQAFTRALEAHRETSSDFRFFVFPTARFSDERFDRPAQFSYAIFPPNTHFVGTHFTQAVEFNHAQFTGSAVFQHAKFDQKAHFIDARFGGSADFDGATFLAEGYLTGATFSGRLSFFKTHFAQRASFGGAEFSGIAEFFETTFGGETSFCRTIFRGQSLFQGLPGTLIFQESAVDFSQVTGVAETIRFRHADLRQCRFDGTDCRRIEFTNVRWPRQSGRTAIFDEIAWPKDSEKRSHWSVVERLYRELKQNHEDRRDYERAGDFHYGEKEMRRRNLDTPAWLRGILFLYWLLGGYGERISRPLVWIIGVLVYCAVVYVWGGLAPEGSSDATMTFGEFPQALRYSFEVMFFLKPDDLAPQAPAGQWLRAIESVLGPIFLGLFALALRQRLRR